MRQTLLTLLAVITLLSQWGWQAHAYEHDVDEPGHICELCVSAASHVAITPSAPALPNIHGSDPVTCATFTSFTSTAARFYPTRAPPAFL